MVRRELRGSVSDERVGVIGEGDQHGRSVCRRGGACDEAATLGALDQAADGGLVEREELAELVHGRFAVAQHAEQPRLDDREIVLGPAALEQAMDQKGDRARPSTGINSGAAAPVERSADRAFMRGTSADLF